MIKSGQQEKLREGDVPGSQFLTEVQHKAALHFHDDVGEAFSIRSKLVRLLGRPSADGGRIQRN